MKWRRLGPANQIALWIAIWILYAMLGLHIGWGAEPPTPPIDWPESVAVGELLILDAPETAVGEPWSVYPPNVVYRIVDSGKTLVVATSAPGTVIIAIAEGTAESVTVRQVAIVIGEGQPDIDPDPIDPVVEGKLHVLLIYETDLGEEGSLSQEQSGIPTAVGMLEYLAGHCADEDGTPAYRFLDPDSDTDGLPEDWQEVFARGLRSGEGKLPWIIIASDQGGSYEGELPDDLVGTMEILKRFGGE